MALKEVIKKMKENNKNFFFGEGNWREVSNKYFKFKRILSDDEIIIITNNVREVKESLVLVVDNNKVIYLKDWQVEPVKAYNENIYAYAVKLNKKYFKTYAFKNEFKDFCFKEEDTFDTLKEVAEIQEKEDIAFSWDKWSVEKL
ncbi:hypothetical protein [Fusobacterium gastrosuis]|uniref:hypothetical protein n=1 Tax=Fusobacterium gastrosuis TaxID=1755100 RepID=UPI00297050CF|nr:hypothetical protein [Fusobacteriaceae bacterium]MDY5713618.1 hypothetical protein [Fusobacterium gastrosuis]